jgi:hypothetical protein
MHNGREIWCGNMKERCHFKNLGTDGRKKFKTWLWSPTSLFPRFGRFQFLLVAKNDTTASGGEGVVSRTSLKFRKSRWPFCTWSQKVSIRGASGNGRKVGYIAWTWRGLSSKRTTTTNKNGKRKFCYRLSQEKCGNVLTFGRSHITWNNSHIVQLSQNKWLKGLT